jgi:hypothetical protein
MNPTIKLTPLQADELTHRLILNDESQDMAHPDDRLPIWGKVEGRTLTIWFLKDCLDDIDNIIDIHDSNSDDPWEGAKARGAARSMRGLRAKIDPPTIDADDSFVITRSITRR